MNSKYPIDHLSILALAASTLMSLPIKAQENQPRAGQNVTVERLLQQMDANKDGQLSRSEVSGLMERYFDRNDANNDGVIDKKELKALEDRLARRNQQQKNPARTGPKNEELLASIPEGVEAHLDLPYRVGESDRWTLDLFVPKAESDKPRPAIVFVHGGGWRNGSKRSATFLNGAIEYAQKGYVTVTLNYRLTGEAPFPACIEDVKCAVRWLRANAEKHNLDPSRIGGYGNSAGAHLVSMLGLAGPETKLEGDGPNQEQSSLIQAVCASATPTDFALFGRDPGADPKWAESGYDPAELSKLSSPITHVKADAPPFLLIHGTADKTVHVKHSDTFEEALKEAGAEDITYLRIDGSGHGVYNEHKAETHLAMEEFFARVLKPGE